MRRVQKRGGPDRRLLRLATAQDDVVTREQAIALGLSRHSLTRLVGEGRWQRLCPGVFVTHNGPVVWSSRTWAGVLLGGDRARLGGRAAAHADGLVDDEPRLIEILVPHDTIIQDRGPWTFVRERAGARSARTTGSPPRTLTADTVLDLCRESTPRQIEDWVTRAVQRQLTTHALLRRALVQRARHPARALLIDLLAEVAEGTESPLELRYLRYVERRHGLPDGKRQRRSQDKKARRDVLYPDYGVVVELDGKKGHEGEGSFRDMRRDNRALLDRLVTLRFGHGDVYGEPCVVAWHVAEVLRMGGWTGRLQRCPACPARLGKS